MTNMGTGGAAHLLGYFPSMYRASGWFPAPHMPGLAMKPWNPHMPGVTVKPAIYICQIWPWSLQSKYVRCNSGTLKSTYTRCVSEACNPSSTELETGRTENQGHSQLLFLAFEAILAYMKPCQTNKIRQKITKKTWAVKQISWLI